MRVARRFERVSGRFALMTQWVAVRRYQGACAWKNVQALMLARNCFSWAGSSLAFLRFSYAYTADFSSERRSKALSPAGCMRPSSMSSLARLMFTALQILVGLRGVNRMV